VHLSGKNVKNFIQYFMSQFVIQGQQKLHGEISVAGAKNAALKIIPAAIFSSSPLRVTNVPDIEDVNKALKLIQSLGASVTRNKTEVVIDASNVNKNSLVNDLAGKFRASVMFVGPLLTRFSEVSFPMPGGCVLSSGAKRPIDLFLEGFQKLGATVKQEKDVYKITAKKLKGCEYFFTKISVTGTESLMMTAVFAEGKTILKNCACEPEIPALANYLNQQGANIQGAGTPTILIEGVKKISGGTYNIIPDRIETGTFAIMAAATNSKVMIKNCQPDHIAVLLNIFNKIGIPFRKGQDWLEIEKCQSIQPYDVKTHEYPGFPTDLQAPYVALMTQANGSSLVHETIYDRRLLYVDMLMQMGGDIIMCDPHRIVVNGPTKLKGKKLTSPDLRAGTAMIIAALIAHGETVIDNIYQIDRGYQRIEKRLRALGANIVRKDG
jgi:UDP-N-acetylglucosamine 1-carboxyvinyltransferase